jgi:hypothetical protein
MGEIQINRNLDHRSAFFEHFEYDPFEEERKKHRKGDYNGKIMENSSSKRKRYINLKPKSFGKANQNSSRNIYKSLDQKLKDKMKLQYCNYFFRWQQKILLPQ